jgi:peptidoglycan/xylan/chitin deacetylase (PgdA/CDA1 family)/ubiquinone/menaquinone biosynthesis C-methylase UbiE
MRTTLVTLFHDIEQNIDVDADPAVCREVVWDMLALEREFGVRCTYNVVGTLMEQQPDLIARIREGGHEIAFHSYEHQRDWHPGQFVTSITDCRRLNPDIKGYRSPRSQWDEPAMDALWRNGFYWTAESDAAPQPYFIHKGLVRLPIAGDDWQVFRGSLSADDWLSRFAWLLRKRRYFGFGSHDCVFASQPERYLSMYRRLLTLIRDQQIATATCGEVADVFRRSAITTFYQRTAGRWNQSTTRLFRTERYRDIVTREADAIPHPVIADLGSAGGALSKHLADARTIFCVDMAEGMLQGITANNVQLVIGDVTDSTLEDHCADLVIAARVTEYLYEPALLLNEIKRIAKRGARIVATFPALTTTPPANEGDPPSRVRKHFTRQEVTAFGQQLGPGRVLGIHHLGGVEPATEEARQLLLDMERRQPGDAQPLDWVFVGVVDDTAPIAVTHRTLPLDDFFFAEAPTTAISAAIAAVAALWRDRR